VFAVGVTPDAKPAGQIGGVFAAFLTHFSARPLLAFLLGCRFPAFVWLIWLPLLHGH
jgi:hypothetical protein